MRARSAISARGVRQADAILARTLDEIASMPDWTPLVDGVQSATLVDGPSTGTRTLADGSTIDLQQVVNMADCQKAAACTVAELDAVSSRRPWGATNPRWQPYAYGPLASLLPGRRQLLVVSRADGGGRSRSVR